MRAEAAPLAKSAKAPPASVRPAFGAHTVLVSNVGVSTWTWLVCCCSAGAHQCRRSWPRCGTHLSCVAVPCLAFLQLRLQCFPACTLRGWVALLLHFQAGRHAASLLFTTHTALLLRAYLLPRAELAAPVEMPRLCCTRAHLPCGLCSCSCTCAVFARRPAEGTKQSATASVTAETRHLDSSVGSSTTATQPVRVQSAEPSATRRASMKTETPSARTCHPPTKGAARGRTVPTSAWPAGTLAALSASVRAFLPAVSACGDSGRPVCLRALPSCIEPC